jgi:hypothetical protein
MPAFPYFILVRNAKHPREILPEAVRCRRLDRFATSCDEGL